ncbi:MAG: hypothetical protein MZV63_54850 [Marinilabiliales bacterium]|nr:hypothetical protein [Marinilabiliales bacterium]
MRRPSEQPASAARYVLSIRMSQACQSLTPGQIMNNLVAQLTSPVRWTQTVEKMIADGASEFVEAGPGNVLQGLIKKINQGCGCFSCCTVSC